jgi:hypothetical protein
MIFITEFCWQQYYVIWSHQTYTWDEANPNAGFIEAWTKWRTAVMIFQLNQLSL